MTLSQNIAGTPFVKMHGTQNHFVIVDARKDAFSPSRDDIVEICDPLDGIGADELIVIEPATSGAAAFMRIFNGDGREVEACGNATRCVAWILFEESGIDQLVLETLAGKQPVAPDAAGPGTVSGCGLVHIPLDGALFERGTRVAPCA